MSNFFDNLNNGIREAEGSVVNFLSAFAPWLTPIIPAYMTFQHAQNTLKFPVWVASTSAVVVEILGFTSISTFMAFWFYNRRNVAEAKKAPLTLVIVAFGFYLSLIVFSNVLLDSFPGSAWAENSVRAFFTLQTIPAALLVSVRTQHRALLKEIAIEKEERTKERNERKERTNRSDEQTSERTNHRTNRRTANVVRPSGVRERIGEFVRTIQENEQRTPGPSEISQALGISKGYASDTLKMMAELESLEDNDANNQ